MRRVIAAVICLTLGACQRAPQNAAELLDRLPRVYVGTLELQGETNAQPVQIECRQLAVRNERVLEFSGVNVILLDGKGGKLLERLASCRGTISAPGFDITIEDPGTETSPDLLKPGSFAGKFSSDLKTAQAGWLTGFGTRGDLKLRASR